MNEDGETIEELEKTIAVCQEMKETAGMDAAVSLGVMLVITYFTYTFSELPQFEQYSNIILGCLIAAWVLSFGVSSIFTLIGHFGGIMMSEKLKEKLKRNQQS